MGGMLLVTDLDRSVAFYRDMLGFSVIDRRRGNAVLASGAAGCCSQVADMSPVDRRVVHLNLEVADVEALYEELKAKGVRSSTRPGWSTGATGWSCGRRRSATRTATPSRSPSGAIARTPLG